VSGEPLQAYDTAIGHPELVAPPVAVPPNATTESPVVVQIGERGASAP